MAAKDRAESEASRLKYTEEAQKAYERLQTPLEKYTARQEELNKALKDGKILQADYNTLMAAAKKDYEATLKKPKQSGVKVSAGDRQEDSAHAALLTLQAELRTLEKHAGANEKISQQRRDLWKAESQFAVLEEAAQRRQLSAQEKSLLAHKDETLEYKRQLAALGDKVTYQEHLNALAQQADKFAQQQRAKRAAIEAKNRGLTDRQAARDATEQRLKEQYGDNPLALNSVMSEQKKTWAAEDQLRGSWMAGLRSGWSEWEESATDSMSQVKSAATQTFDGIAQNMAAMLTGSEQNWRSFTRSVLSMMTEILLKQAMVGSSGVSAVSLAVHQRQAVQPFRHLRRNSILRPEDLREPAANMSQRGLFTVVNLSSRRRQPAGLAWGIFTGLCAAMPPAVMSVHRAAWRTVGRRRPGRLSRITMW